MPIDLQQSQSMALICAVMGRDQRLLEQARRQLEKQLGPIHQPGPIYPFDYTTYYAAEMGANLVKQLIWFSQTVDPAVLPGTKRQTMKIERELAEEAGGKIARRVNIDPGLVSIESLVLASTKYSGHRICIAPSLYAETTLLFRRGRYRPCEWTYLDYQTDTVQDFLQTIRTYLLQQQRL